MYKITIIHICKSAGLGMKFIAIHFQWVYINCMFKRCVLQHGGLKSIVINLITKTSQTTKILCSVILGSLNLAVILL